MLERIAFVLFYGVMALVAVTCLTQMAALSAFHDPNWFSAWGSWFGGLGSLIASVTAIGIAFWQRSIQQRQQSTEFQRRRTLLARRLSVSAARIRNASSSVASLPDYLEKTNGKFDKPRIISALTSPLKEVQSDISVTFDQIFYIHDIDKYIYEINYNRELYVETVEWLASDDEEWFDMGRMNCISHLCAIRRAADELSERCWIIIRESGLYDTL